MAKKKNGKQKLTGIFKGGSIKKRLFPIVKTVTAPLSFFEQITSFDRASAGNNFSQAGYGTQLKMISNMVLGRIAGDTASPTYETRKTFFEGLAGIFGFIIIQQVAKKFNII